jgi:hypothetical protein
VTVLGNEPASVIAARQLAEEARDQAVRRRGRRPRRDRVLPLTPATAPGRDGGPGTT